MASFSRRGRPPGVDLSIEKRASVTVKGTFFDFSIARGVKPIGDTKGLIDHTDYDYAVEVIEAAVA